MKTLSLIQGSQEWLTHRTQFWNASDAPAVMGVSPYSTRTELLTRIKTGITPEVDDATQRRFDEGHRIEALARSLAEGILGEELYPVTGSKGKYSASFDGLTLEGNIAFEHKTLNDELRSAFAHMDTLPLATQERDAAKSLPAVYQVQMEQQCMVSGCDRVLFMASKWNGDELVAEHHCWYFSDELLRIAIEQGWEQFERDLQTFEPPAAAAPAPAGKAPDTLPALRIEVSGQVTASNLAEFKETALAAIRSVNRELATDQDFADAEQSVKWCSDVESRLAAAKEHALSQTASIDQLFKAIDDISAEARSVRLELEKLVKSRKEALRMEIVRKAAMALGAHISSLDDQIGKPNIMPSIASGFAGVIKGKRSITSIQDAVDTELARAKIEANDLASRITINLRAINEQSEHTHLFPDFRTLVLKAPEDLAAVIDQRIAKYKQYQDDAHRREQRIESDKSQAFKDEQERKEREAAAAAAATAAPLPVMQPPKSPAPVVDTGVLINTSQINALLAPIRITGEGLAELGFAYAGSDRSSKLFRESDFTLICEALIKHIKHIDALHIEALTATA